MTQKRGPVNLRPQTHLLLEKLQKKTKLSKTQIVEDALKDYRERIEIDDI